jgi:two-component system chemotaxis response regulator CheB
VQMYSSLRNQTTRSGDKAAPIRLMIVDDSIVARTIVSRMLEDADTFEIVAAVADGQQALDVARRELLDIILLDLEMPGISGLTLLPMLLEASRGARVMIVSSAASEGAAATVEALALGAADALQKPGAGQVHGGFAKTLIDRIIRIGPVRRGCAAKMTPPPGRAASIESAIDCLAIGASTGGIHALTVFFKELPLSFTPPILVTQHLPASFMPYFADQLHDISGRPTTVARDGERLVAGTIYVAPGDGHINLIRLPASVHIRIERTQAVTRCMPSVDPMFEGLANVYGKRGLAVVLSGMGRDGTIGAHKVVEAGGEVIAQDAASSVVWGMPGSVAEAGLASLILPPNQLARRVIERGQRQWT